MLITCRHIKQKLYGNSFFPPAVVLWNNTPLGIRKSLSLKKFKTRLNKSESNVPFYCYEGDRRQNIQHCRLCLGIDHIFSRFVARERERNVLFNNALNTFYLRLYGVRHMVKDHSDSEKGNPLPPHRLLLSINSKGSFICTIP